MTQMKLNGSENAVSKNIMCIGCTFWKWFLYTIYARNNVIPDLKERRIFMYLYGLTQIYE